MANNFNPWGSTMQQTPQSSSAQSNALSKLASGGTLAGANGASTAGPKTLGKPTPKTGTNTNPGGSKGVPTQTPAPATGGAANGIMPTNTVQPGGASNNLQSQPGVNTYTSTGGVRTQLGGGGGNRYAQ